MLHSTIKLLLCISLLYLVFTTISCSDKSKPMQEVLTEYYEVYKNRSDFKRFLDFYDENVLLEDVINGDKINGKKALTDFFNWDNPGFKLLDSVALVVEEQIIENNKAVIKGYFTPFSWNGTRFEAMQFTTILTFNKNGKVIKQVDWIKYPSSLTDQ